MAAADVSMQGTSDASVKQQGQAEKSHITSKKEYVLVKKDRHGNSIVYYKKSIPSTSPAKEDKMQIDEDASPVKKKIKTKVYPKVKLRPSITPGTVLIILKGKYSAKRVIFLKQLESGYLAVTGPKKLNGVPIYRIDQTYVIATSTKIDISNVKLPLRLNDDLFKKLPSYDRLSAYAKISEEKQEALKTLFLKKKKQALRVQARIQKYVDKQVISAVDSVPKLSKYLSLPFNLGPGIYPHRIKF
ncbi:60S ribosomal protein L6-like [Schistocerca gregaria]|uniref:60S ribosomal protein L6-like n=1 Tax=Schistocerca gregaria TaxID=7010 RepID=UPI00211F07C2|nr:60S ribosomal protein L6-like [Schistocerca gregaria]